MRVLGIDLGGRRTGVAISDPTGSLARPLLTLEGDPLPAVIRLVGELSAEADGLGRVVVGLPTRLSGESTPETERARAFAQALAGRIALPVELQDERLSSVEAASRLAHRREGWKAVRARLDAAAAAVILQDHLDGAPPSSP